jgi:hypothetical protein
MSRRCRHCSVDFDAPVRGRPRVYCSPKCRQAAYVVRLVLRASVSETGEPVRSLRTLAEAESLLAADMEMVEYGAEVLRKVTELERLDTELIHEAERTGRVQWRYESDDEAGLREAAQAFREFQQPIEVWVDYD